MLTTVLLNIARAIGIAAAGGAFVLYGTFVLSVGYLTPEITAMILLTLLAGWASFRTKPLILCVAFSISFFPVGLYLLGTPGYLRWIVVCDVLYLIAAGLMFVARALQKLGGSAESPEA